MPANQCSITRCCACMAKYDPVEAIGLMGAGLFLPNRELILEMCRQEMKSTSSQRHTAERSVKSDSELEQLPAMASILSPSRTSRGDVSTPKTPVRSLLIPAATGLKTVF